MSSRRTLLRCALAATAALFSARPRRGPDARPAAADHLPRHHPHRRAAQPAALQQGHAQRRARGLRHRHRQAPGRRAECEAGIRRHRHPGPRHLAADPQGRCHHRRLHPQRGALDHHRLHRPLSGHHHAHAGAGRRQVEERSPTWATAPASGSRSPAAAPPSAPCPPPLPKATLVRFNTQADEMSALMSGQVDAMAEDDFYNTQAIKDRPGKLRQLDGTLARAEIAHRPAGRRFRLSTAC